MYAKTLYTFLGVAIVIGAVTGTGLHYMTGFIVSLLHLAPEPAEEPELERSLPTYREDRRERTADIDVSAKLVHDASLARNQTPAARQLKDWEWSREERGRSRSGLIPNTILEEDDSSEYGL